jgi:hypothetical protein
MKRNLLKEHLVEVMVTYDFTPHLKVRDHTTWFWRCLGTGLCTLSFGLSQFHSHGSWLVCEVALNVNMNNFGSFEQFYFLQIFIFVLDKDRNNFHERKERNVTTKPICVGFDHKLCCKSTELDRLISKLHKFRGLDNVVGSLFRPLQEHWASQVDTKISEFSRVI